MRDCAGAKGADLNFSLLQAIPQGKCHLHSSIHIGLPCGDSREVKQVKKPKEISTIVAQVLGCPVSWLQFSQDHCSHHKQLTQKISNEAIPPHPLLLSSQYTEMLKTNQMCHIRLFCDKILRRLLLTQPVLKY